MDQAFTAGENRQAAFSGWCFNETVEIARQRQALEEQKKEIMQEKDIERLRYWGRLAAKAETLEEYCEKAGLS